MVRAHRNISTCWQLTLFKCNAGELLQGEALLAKVKDAKLLVIGAGGIGCELLKNLVLTGFQDIEVSTCYGVYAVGSQHCSFSGRITCVRRQHVRQIVFGASATYCNVVQVVDLDTIDVSNLNRQFLFRPHHVGKSKAEVAREAVLEFNPSARIVAYHANIKEDRFGVEYFENFDIVINALDNVAARKHVNRLCLATNKPLIEAGTQGYEGQAYLIKKGVTECFECVPKPIQKKFPVCTIRSTPDKPVHCVVWAKELHKLLLGDVKTSYLYEETTGAEAPAAGSDDGAAPARAESVYMHLVTDRLATMDDAQATAYARDVFQAIFHDEIAKRLEMAPETYKTAARPPQPLDLTKVERGAYPDSTNAAGGAGAGAPGGRNGRLRDQMVLSLQESAELFVTTLAGYFKDAANAPNIGALEFNKDSAADLHLVTAATNLRAYTFGIPTQSRFDVKSIAGNIIPAIATTNAVVAGLQVMEALKILRGDDVMQTGKYTYCKRLESTSKRALLMATSLCPPNKNCIVCGTMGLTLFIDTRKTTLKTFVDVVSAGFEGLMPPPVSNMRLLHV